jgi:FixJ family two-component response regulator
MASVDSIVYVVDDDPAVRASLSSLLRSTGLRVETFGTADEFRRHSRVNVPSCLILDVQLPDSSGLDLLAELNASEEGIPVVFITGHGSIPMGVRAIKEGAVEFLTKPFEEMDLISAVQQALERDRVARARRMQLGRLRERWERLTPREREVLALVAKGRLNKQIARELGAAEQTIKVHRGRVMRKLEARSVPELVRFMEEVAGQPWTQLAASAEPPRRSTARPEA